jgi:hypothetical protein
MMTVSTSEESERRLAEAMRAHASGVGRPGFVGRNPGSPAGHLGGPTGANPAPPQPWSGPGGAAAGTDAQGRAGVWRALVDARLTLLLALLGGAVLGIALALLSLLAPGVLPPLG